MLLKIQTRQVVPKPEQKTKPNSEVQTQLSTNQYGLSQHYTSKLVPVCAVCKSPYLNKQDDTTCRDCRVFHFEKHYFQKAVF